ncbi:MAG: CDP-glycerol glycerophosphotransferase family protein, partial [Castellaniella sp.]
VFVRERKVAFVVKRSVPFSGNTRILAEALLECGGYQLVVYKDGPLDDACISWRARGVRVYQKASWRALCDVHSASTVVLGHSGRDARLTRRKTGRRIINLWHGVAIKRIERLMHAPLDQDRAARFRYGLMRINSQIYDAVISSSYTDRLTNSLAFGVDLDRVYITGLPRFDYLSPTFSLPQNLQADVDRLDMMLDGRRMLLYAPTFRENRKSILSNLSATALSELKVFLKSRDLVLGIRPHPYDQKNVSSLCDGEWVVDLRPDIYMEPAVLLRAASTLIVDYSSIWVDYLLLKRPIIGLMPDIDEYQDLDRGFIFDVRDVFPGPILNSWSRVIESVSRLYDRGFSMDDDIKSKFINAEALFLPPPHRRFGCTQRCMDLFF